MGCIRVRHKIDAEKQLKELFKLKDSARLCILPPNTTVLHLKDTGGGSEFKDLSLSQNKLYRFSHPIQFQEGKVVYYSLISNHKGGRKGRKKNT